MDKLRGELSCVVIKVSFFLFIDEIKLRYEPERREIEIG
jgi:hypothetical protein